MDEAIDADVHTIRNAWSQRPQLAIVLGSGLDSVADRLNTRHVWRYADLCGFPSDDADGTRVAGHRGELRVGDIDGVSTIMLCGRHHFYEGHSLTQITHGVRLMAALGVPRLWLTNAAGGINQNYAVGDWMMIDDLIWWWRGLGGVPGDVGLPRSDVPRGAANLIGTQRNTLFDAALVQGIVDAADANAIPLRRGCYLSTTGPTYETPAEYRMMRTIGVDAVGMSTAAEAIAASTMGMRVAAMSMISNVADPDAPTITDHAEVLEAGRLASDRMADLLQRWVGRLPQP